LDRSGLLLDSDAKNKHFFPVNSTPFDRFPGLSLSRGPNMATPHNWTLHGAEYRRALSDSEFAFYPTSKNGLGDM
jgi:hypothetical protein